VVVVMMMMVMVMVMLMVVMLMVMSVSVKVFRESDFEVHGARDGIYGGYADCGVFAKRGSLRLGTDRRAIFWNGRCVFGVHS
jgi:hypothetical protein